MIRAYRELEGCMQLLGHVLCRLPVLRLPPMAEQLTRQIYLTGASAAVGIVTRGAFFGTLIIVYVIEVLEADAALAVKILLWVVLREMGPLLAALLVLQRSGTAVATELALMQITGVIAVGGGMLLSTLVVNAAFDELADSFFLLASPMDIVYSLLKSLLFGVSI